LPPSTVGQNVSESFVEPSEKLFSEDSNLYQKKTRIVDFEQLLQSEIDVSKISSNKYLKKRKQSKNQQKLKVQKKLKRNVSLKQPIKRLKERKSLRKYWVKLRN